MTPVKQEFRHKPDEGIYGDCHRAVIASLLGLPLNQVPHFAEGNVSDREFNERVERFLNKWGYTSVAFPVSNSLPDLLEWMFHLSPNAYYILGGESRNGVNHSVICHKGKIVHDPSLDVSGIVGPCSDGYYWVTVLSPI